MGHSILKGKPDVDLYCVWSSSVGQPVLIGTAEEIVEAEAEHVFHEGDTQCRAIPPERTRQSIAYADEHGTSSRWRPAYGRWDDDSGIMVAQEGMLPRDKLYDFLVILNDSQEWFDTGVLPEGAIALIEPFEDDDGE